MSIVLEGGSGIGGSGFVRGIGCVAIYESPEIEGRNPVDLSPSPSSSSSIGKDSDGRGSWEEEEEEEEEVESAYKGALQGMESLEESLPIRRGISNFYNGKSKSFTSLLDASASCVSAKDLSKDDNAYTRKRRNLLAFKTILDGPHNTLKSSKKPTPARRTLSIAVAMSGAPKHGNECEDAHSFRQNCLPPLPRPGKSSATIASAGGSGGGGGSSSLQQLSFPLRSFSLGDLSQIDNLGYNIH